MEKYRDVFIVVSGFIVITLASKQIGQFFAKAKFPLITGFLFAGILAGPLVLDFLPAETIGHLRFVNEIALAFIAFSAGSELYLKDLRSRLQSITWVTIGLTSTTFILSSTTVFLLAGHIPFMEAMSPTDRVAVSILAGAILVARSPSSAIAIVTELRAKGPFTQTALGVTVIMDAVVIILFSVNSEIADALLTNLNFNITFMMLLVLEFVISLACSYGLAKLLGVILSRSRRQIVKSGMILLSGYGVFVLSDVLRTVSRDHLAFEILLEPLLICMVTGFLMTNYSEYRDEFLNILDTVAPPIYIAFFTLAGASLELNILAVTWPVALVLFLVRLVAIFIGSFIGGAIAGDPMSHNRISWMAYVTQAGIGLGLAEELSVEFPEWGADFAPVIVSVIVLNQIIGPVLFKRAIHQVGEAHRRARTPEFDTKREAIIFGLEDQSLTLARQLCLHGWQVKVASTDTASREELLASDVYIHVIPDLTREALEQLGASHADAIVVMLTDEENYRICELAYEHFGIETMVVRLNDRFHFDRFHQLGALIVDPSTAMISLLDHFVRSPSGASLLLGMEEDQDIIDLEVHNPDLHGMAVRELRLPRDALIMSVHRKGQLLVSHGYTCLELGDRVTVVGSAESLEQIRLRLE